jgi:hypothetical protein
MTELSFLQVVEEDGRALVSNGVIAANRVEALRAAHSLGGRGVRIYLHQMHGAVPRIVGALPHTLRELVTLYEIPERYPRAPPAFVATFMTAARERRTTVLWFSIDTSSGRERLVPLDVAAAGSTEGLIETWHRNFDRDELLVEVDAGAEAIETLLEDLDAPAPATTIVLPSDTDASARKRTELLDQGWPDSAEVGDMLGSQAGTNPGQFAARLRKQRRLLGVRVPGQTTIRHPLCQFHEGALLPVMIDLLAILPPGNGSGWSQAFWLYSPHPLLDSRLPADLLASAPHQVLEAAREQFAETADAGR